jgi:hypothetical protein
VQDVQKPLVVLPAVPAETGVEALRFAAGQGREGRLHGSQADARTDAAHQADRLVACERMAAVTRTAQRLGRQAVFAPAVFPGGQGAGGNPEPLGCLHMSQAQAARPTVEGHGLATGVTLGFAPLALGGPSAL